jgi:hypothetical protein
LVAAVGLTIVLVVAGVAAIAFGLLLAAYGGGFPGIALAGFIMFGSGLAFAFKVAVPAWRSVRDGE